jgi:predicted amidohydrolase YtcJ
MSIIGLPRAIVGGTLIDGTGRPPIHDSIVVLNDQWIEAVGKKGEIQVPEKAEIIEASGKTVLPGLIDAHVHFIWMGMRMIRYLDLSKTRSLAEAVEVVKKKLEEVEKGEWVLGRGWDDSKWEEKRFINKNDVDPFTPENPVALTRVCGHMIALNSKALEITKGAQKSLRLCLKFGMYKRPRRWFERV